MNWIGTNSVYFDDPANWDTGAEPTQDDDIVIDQTTNPPHMPTLLLADAPTANNCTLIVTDPALVFNWRMPGQQTGVDVANLTITGNVSLLNLEQAAGAISVSAGKHANIRMGDFNATILSITGSVTLTLDQVTDGSQVTWTAASITPIVNVNPAVTNSVFTANGVTVDMNHSVLSSSVTLIMLNGGSFINYTRGISGGTIQQQQQLVAMMKGAQ